MIAPAAATAAHPTTAAHPASTSAASTSGIPKKTLVIIIVAAVGGALLLGGGGWFIWRYLSKKKREAKNNADIEDKESGMVNTGATGQPLPPGGKQESKEMEQKQGGFAGILAKKNWNEGYQPEEDEDRLLSRGSQYGGYDDRRLPALPDEKSFEIGSDPEDNVDYPPGPKRSMAGPDHQRWVGEKKSLEGAAWRKGANPSSTRQKYMKNRPPPQMDDAW